PEPSDLRPYGLFEDTGVALSDHCFSACLQVIPATVARSPGARRGSSSVSLGASATNHFGARWLADDRASALGNSGRDARCRALPLGCRLDRLATECGVAGPYHRIPVLRYLWTGPSLLARLGNLGQRARRGQWGRCSRRHTAVPSLAKARPSSFRTPGS